MIITIGNPGNLRGKWERFIQRHHAAAFGHALPDDLTGFWWFVGFRQGDAAGLAGARPETPTTLLLAPCIVFPRYRGLGLQRDFIAHREAVGRREGFDRAVSLTHSRNHASAANLARCGYSAAPPWTAAIPDDGTFVAWQKRL